jgi:hypothetical protein
MWKILRVSVLLLVLAFVASGTWFEQRRVHAWRQTLYVGIFPLAGDDSPVTRDYVAHLDRREFTALESFFGEQAKIYGLPLTSPVRVELYPAVTPLPPAPPEHSGVLPVVWWSLSLRYYAWRHGSAPQGPAPPIRIFVVYHDPALTPRVPHSAGLEKGLIGVANVFALARMSATNNVVIGHEFLHTLGATDKYDPATDAPIFPVGYGDPRQEPRYPQQFAELMAGRIALSPTEQETPESLTQCVLGPETAREIHWLKR